ncbi:MAG: DUF1564 family protein [Leptospiraceae bacterium]|nr:DUF1564 family protein [Leptospiraceae bacterium]
MIIFRNSNTFVMDKLDERENTVSTLLIPECLLKEFYLKNKKRKEHFTVYLRKLLRRYRTVTHTGLLPKPQKVKAEYQEEGQNLERVNFRPRNTDWIELGELALAFGKSRCWVFVYLLKLDLLGMWRLLVKATLEKIVPTLPSLELTSFWTLQRFRQNFARGYHVKV